MYSSFVYFVCLWLIGLAQLFLIDRLLPLPYVVSMLLRVLVVGAAAAALHPTIVDTMKEKSETKQTVFG